MKKILMAAVGAIMVGAIAVAQTVPSFPDVVSSDWFADASNFAREHEFITGIDGRFEPATTVNRAQAAVMLQKFASNVHMELGGASFMDPWFGFQLVFPTSWRGYLFETVHGRNQSGLLTTNNFGLINNTRKFERIMSIFVWTKSAWDAAGRSDQEVVGDNGTFVVTLSRVQTVSPELVVARDAVNAIKSSFRFVGTTTTGTTT